MFQPLIIKRDRAQPGILDTVFCVLYNFRCAVIMQCSRIFMYMETFLHYDREGIYTVSVVRGTLNHHVYQELRELVVSGAMVSGAQLDEQALADRMGVSRTPLREAIGLLVKDGLLEDRPYRGKFVRTFTSKQVGDLFAVRKVLEGSAVRFAVPKLTTQRLAELRMILNDVQAALAARELTWYSTADHRFHSAIAEFSENEVLIDCLNRLGWQIQIVRVSANEDPSVVARTALERPRILAALEARDAESAARLMEKHIEGVGEAVVARLEALEHSG